MTDNSPSTAKTIEIHHPEVWSLALHLHPNCLKYVLYSSVEDNSLTYGTIEFRGESGNYIRALETAIYDNPFLLSPFGRLRILVESDSFLLVPDEFSAGGDVAECWKYFSRIYPDDRRNLAVDSIADAGCSLVYAIDRELEAFLRRTFNNPPMIHFLTPMIKFFNRKAAYGGQNKMFVYLNNDKVEIVAIRNSKFVLANSYPFKETENAFYYIMNAWQQCGMNQTTDEMHITGDKQTRNILLPELRQYVRNVMQVIFPADLLRLGNDVMAAPFDLIILPLCE